MTHPDQKETENDVLVAYAKKAWDMYGDSLLTQVKGFEQFITENEAKIDQIWGYLCNFYGVDLDNLEGYEGIKAMISLKPGNGYSGGVLSNFRNTEDTRSSELRANYRWLEDSGASVFVFLSPVEYLEEGGYISSVPDWGFVDTILHEASHEWLQFDNNEFYRLISKAEDYPDIQELVEKLEARQGPYTPVILELVTLYMSRLSSAILSGEVSIESAIIPKSPKIGLLYGEEYFVKLLSSSIIDYQENPDPEQTKSPAVEGIHAWNNVLALPVEFVPTAGVIAEKDPSANLYMIFHHLPLDLAKEYFQTGKALDVDFIRRLLNLTWELIEQQDKALEQT